MIAGDERPTLAELGPASPDALDALPVSRGLEPGLRELVEVRTSQLNGCADSLARHVLDALALGERHERLVAVGRWRSSPLFTERERAALALADALALLPAGRVLEEARLEAAASFDHEELVQLVATCAAANAWDRVAAATGELPAARAA